MSTKGALRQAVKEKRDALSREEREQKAFLIKEKLFSLPEFANANAVLFYASFGSEVPTLGMIEDAIKLGKRVILPVTDTRSKRLFLREINGLGDLRDGAYGILEPNPDTTDPFEADLIDLIIVPGVVFDSCGHRIGYGGGYYDRFLSDINATIPRISIAFEVQVIAEIPAESHDLPVDKLITEGRIISACENRV